MHRKKPFSHKQKREQLKDKRATKRNESNVTESGAKAAKGKNSNASTDIAISAALESNSTTDVATLLSNFNFTAHNRLNTFFRKESEQQIQNGYAQGRDVLIPLSQESLEVNALAFFMQNGRTIELLSRPSWSYEMTKEQLEMQERLAFDHWLRKLFTEFSEDMLGYFELNIEVWRQLWRTVEISDIILLITDIRHPMIHLPPGLYNYIVHQMNRPLIVVFNKVDLVPRSTVLAWKDHFHQYYPKIHVVTFSSFPESFPTRQSLFRSKSKGRRKYQAFGVVDLLNACKNVPLVKNHAEVNWQAIIDGYIAKLSGPVSESITIGKDWDVYESQSSESDETLAETIDLTPRTELDYFPNKQYITLGLIGSPNVGKSSMINGILGKKVVSTSRTPGHTKHFQTIYLTNDVRLCDCPGLVFPSFVPKQIQILSGVYPIAQVREPYSAIKYLAERVPLEKLLHLEKPDDLPWTAFSICEAYAIQRGFVTSKAARPDAARAANHLLRMATDGRIILSFKPPGYYSKLTYYESRAKVDEKDKVQVADVESLSVEEADDSMELSESINLSLNSGRYALLNDDAE